MIISQIIKKIINFLFYRNFGIKNYPREFRYIIKYCKKKILQSQNFKIEKNLLNQDCTVLLASKKIKLNTINHEIQFNDKEDEGYLHRWSWSLNQKKIK